VVLLEQKIQAIFALFCLHNACGLFREPTLKHSINAMLSGYNSKAENE
jgi:hypothetical protein